MGASQGATGEESSLGLQSDANAAASPAALFVMERGAGIRQSESSRPGSVFAIYWPFGDTVWPVTGWQETAHGLTTHGAVQLAEVELVAVCGVVAGFLASAIVNVNGFPCSSETANGM